MRVRCRSVLTMATAVVVAASAVPAVADNTAPTTLTFHVQQTDGLNITAPSTSDLPIAAAPGFQTSGPFGQVDVTDQRSALNASWTATVESTDFKTGGGTPAETIPASDVNYSPGAAINPINGPFTPGTPGNLGSSPMTAFRHPSGSGDNSVGWNPTLLVSVPSNAVVGTYTGTITHSVA